ncbi:MAG TPA: TniB family NTP-binding protein [Acetobacteraceae bacterium]|nr:TniB family NTP-binding protein [Acetobacteraceae bacterium]
MTDPSFPHLHPKVGAIAALPERARRRYIQRPKFVPTAEAVKALETLERLYTHQRTHRLLNVMIIGETNLGKTTIFEEMQKRHRGSNSPRREFPFAPLLKVEMAWWPKPQSLYDQILMPLQLQYGIKFDAKAPFAEKESDVIYWLAKLKVKILFIDEAQNFGRRPSLTEAFMQALIMLNNALRITICLIGLESTANVVNSHPQSANRFAPFRLARWRSADDPGFLDFIDTYEGLLPLREESRLTSPAIRNFIFDNSEGVLGEAVDLMHKAAERALGGSERIRLDELQAVGFVPPRARPAATRPPADAEGVEEKDENAEGAVVA